MNVAVQEVGKQGHKNKQASEGVQKMEIKRIGVQLPEKDTPSILSALYVLTLCSSKRSGTRGRRKCTFEPGARTAWHSHPLGRGDVTGLRSAQSWGGPIQEIRPGT